MSGPSLLTDGDIVLVDTNIFLALGKPPNQKYARFKRAVQAAEVVVTIPQRVAGELGGPETKPIRQALDDGWAELVTAPDPADGDPMQASDIARRAIANQTGQPEHDVEKADTIFASLAVQYLRTQDIATVVILTDDNPAREAIKTALRTLGYENAVSAYGVEDILDEYGDGSMRLI